MYELHWHRFSYPLNCTKTDEEHVADDTKPRKVMGYPKSPVTACGHKEVRSSFSHSALSSSTVPMPGRTIASTCMHKKEQKLVYPTFSNSCFFSESI